MGRIAKDDGWRLGDRLWERIEPLLPPRKAHPLGCTVRARRIVTR